MAAAGMVSGICIGLSYGLLFKIPSIVGWIKYNSLYILMFLLLGLTSIIIFEPVTTAAALMETNARPGELIEGALPVTAVFTISFAVILSLLYGQRLLHYGVILLTCTVLMIVLGLNVSILGLVDIPTGAFYLVMELFALIIVIMAVYAAAFIVLEKKKFSNDKKYIEEEA